MPKRFPNKLVRDRIPEIIQSTGGTCETSVLSDAEYCAALREKIIEEAQEVAESENREMLLSELADLQEVIRSLMSTEGLTTEEVEIVRQQRCQERGGFEQRLQLRWVESP